MDFRRDKLGIPGRVATLEYDPNRSAFIALVVYKDGEKRYMLAPEGLKVGATVLSGPDAPLEPGNHLPLARIPLGMNVHNVEMQPGRGGQLVRAAGAVAVLMAREGEYATLRMPSGEMRQVLARCCATHRGGGQPGAHERLPRQGRPQPLAGPAPARARRGHEPARPSRTGAARARPPAAATR